MSEVRSCCVCGLRFSAADEPVDVPCGEAHPECAGRTEDPSDEGGSG